MNNVYTEKQLELLHLCKSGGLRYINVLSGSVRSGKTWVSLVMWAFWILQMPKDGYFLMAAKTLTSLRRNCLDLLQELVGERSFTYNLSRKEARLFGRLVYLEGCNDARAESKIRGMTLHGAYCDELTQFTEDFFDMLLTRLSAKNAKLFATTNPAWPTHWLMRKYISRADEVGLLLREFFLDDNTKLPEDFVAWQKSLYTGVFYERFILGKWVVAEGTIYDRFANNPDSFIVDSDEYLKDKPVMSIFSGADWGNNTAANTQVVVAVTRGYKELVVLDEMYTTNKLEPEEIYEEHLKVFRRVTEKRGSMRCFGDNAIEFMVRGLHNSAIKAGLPVYVQNCIKYEIINRIILTNSLFTQGRLKIDRKCVHLIDAFKEAVWEKGKEDMRLDDGTSNIDSLDAFEYAICSIMKQLELAGRVNSGNR